MDRSNGHQDGSAAAPPDDETAETTLEEVESGPPQPLPLDAVFEVLKNQRRRLTLHYLNQHDGPVSIGDLAEHVAVEENDISPKELSSTERKRAYVGLYQCHLPKMDELGAIDYNRDRGIIEPGPNVDQLEPYLDGPDDPDPWPQYYLALAGVNVTLFGGWLVVGTILPGGLSTAITAVVGGIAVLSFAALAGLHHLRWRDEDESDRSAD